MTEYIRVQNHQSSTLVEGRHHCRLGRPLEPSHPGGDCQGIFAEWDWDGQRLEVRNDRYGIYPLFYFQDGREIVVSDSLTTVVDIVGCRELDFDALAVFLRCHLYVGGDTPFRKVRQVPPGTTLVWTDGRCKLVSRPPAPRPVSFNRDEAVDAYTGLFRQAIRRRLPVVDGQDVVVPLSGGQDSRHILLELIEHGRPPARCVTVSREWSPKLMVDVRLATEVARTAGVSHTVLMQDDPIFQFESRKNALTNFCTAEHAWFLTLVDHGGLAGALVLDGLAGDILSACPIRDDRVCRWYKEGQFALIADHLLGPEEVHRDLLTGPFYAQATRERAIARLAEEVGRHADAINPQTEFVFWNRTRRSIAPAPYAILNSVTTVDTPYLDNDLFDFLIALPPDLIDRDFHKRTIRAAYPRFAGIPFSEISYPVADSAKPYTRYARDLARSLLRSSPRRPSMFRKAYVVPRLTRCLVEPRYALATAWLPQAVVYLSQLDMISDTGGGRRLPGRRLAGQGTSST